MNGRKENMLEDIEAVIFDMDGTLIDSMWIWTTVDEAYLRKYNLKQPENFHEIMEGKSYTEVAQLFVEFFPELNRTAEQIMEEWFDMTYELYATQVRLKEGVHDMISGLKSQGIRFGIATSNAKELVDAALSSLNISGFFDSVHTSGEVGAGKPSPDVYLLVADDLGVSPERCLVFEDVPMGILGGKNAGMTVCGVDDAFSRPLEAKKKELADYYIRTYHDVLNHTYEVL